MLLFCPHCGNLLKVQPDSTSRNCWTCLTCPYQMPIKKRYFERTYMKTKEVEDVLGGADSWKNVDKTGVNCANPNCDGAEAYFRQVQIRSADEPMTTFYKCVTCANEWREN